MWFIGCFQDKIDDIMLGVKSTAIKFGDQTKSYLSLFSATMLSSLIVAGMVANQTLPYYLATGLVGTHLAHQVDFIFTNKFVISN